MNYLKRIEAFQEKLRRKRIDAFLVTQPCNRRYLCGYTPRDHGIAESSGALFVPAHGEALLLTDFRYQAQAQRETPLTIQLYRRGLLLLLSNLWKKYAVKVFGFESHYTLHSFGLKLLHRAEKQHVRLQPCLQLIEQMRVIKDQDELELIRHSVGLNERVFSAVFPDIKAGMRERDIAARIENQMRVSGAESPSFDTIVAAGPNSALPHASPGPNTIKNQDSVTIDMGLIVNGYCSDMTRNFAMGSPSQRYRERHRVVRKAQQAGLAAVKAGVPACEVDKAARQIISEAGYGTYFGHSLGHGVGLEVHEEPRISPKSRQKLKAGMVITIEPGIYLPEWGGIRLENMVIVTETGAEPLNSDTTWLDI